MSFLSSSVQKVSPSARFTTREEEKPSRTGPHMESPGRKRRAKKGPFFLVSLFLESIFFHILKIEVRRRENRLIGGSLHLIYEES